MTLFVAVVHDRHTNPVIRVFTDPVVAVAWAKKNFKACLAHPEGLREDTPSGEEIVWEASYECHDMDCAWVEAVELDDGSDA
jgi:hypothetical protein